MSRLVVLSLGQGNLHEGFPSVTVQIGEPDNPYRMKYTASLPAAPEIYELYRHWQLLYSAFYQRLSLRVAIAEIEEIDDTFEVEEAYVTNISELDITNLCQQLSLRINTWLNSTEFRKIDQQLRTQLEPSEEIRFIIETNDNLLRRLPWHLWNLFDDYPQAEVALSASEYKRSKKLLPQKAHGDKVRILAIFGNSKGIDIGKDRAILSQLSEEAETEFLVEPQPEQLNEQLWLDWDILFFAGHSSSNEKGRIQLNQTDSLTLDQLKYALKKAIIRGLKLAIFNSCDGLGLAQALFDLHIPQVIVMREPVPDVVAQEFLRHFLTAFSGGQSLYASVREARERLERIEGKYPCATWLPLICQNPAEVPTTWQDLLAPQEGNSAADRSTVQNHLISLNQRSIPTALATAGNAAVPEAETSLLGTSVNNRYQIQRVLGQGNFGRTYLASDEQCFGELCVLKEIVPSSRAEYTVQKLRALFETEARVLYQINHPQIPRFLGYFAQMGRLFIVQEYIDGKTYAELLRECHQQGQFFSEASVIQWLKDLLPVLAYLHERNLVHRDISLDNIMLPNGKSRPMLIDFGLVKQTVTQILAYKPNSPSGSGQSFGGKFGYVPPEQIRMGQCYPCSDIYALGVTAVVLLTGREPNLLMAQGTLEWQWRSYVEVSSRLGRILDKMLADKPKERYQSAQEVLVELHAVNPETQPEAVTLPKLNPAFLDRCRQELARRMGPMASYILEETLAEYPDISPVQLVLALAAEIPNPQQANEFRQLLLL